MKYSADDIMEVACECYCKYILMVANGDLDEFALEDKCEKCRLNAMIRSAIRN